MHIDVIEDKIAKGEMNAAQVFTQMKQHIPTKKDNEIKAAAVMDFVNVQIAAFDSGFVESNTVSLYSMYRFAQHHVKDNYSTETKLMSEQWGDSTAELARIVSER